MEIGAIIRKIRLGKNITQKDLAKAANISNSYLSDIEKGRSNPSLKTLRGLAKALEVKINDFF